MMILCKQVSSNSFAHLCVLHTLFMLRRPVLSPFFFHEKRGGLPQKTGWSTSQETLFIHDCISFGPNVNSLCLNNVHCTTFYELFDYVLSYSVLRS
jgi:hypothetical protein